MEVDDVVGRLGPGTKNEKKFMYPLYNTVVILREAFRVQVFEPLRLSCVCKLNIFMKLINFGHKGALKSLTTYKNRFFGKCLTLFFSTACYTTLNSRYRL